MSEGCALCASPATERLNGEGLCGACLAERRKFLASRSLRATVTGLTDQAVPLRPSLPSATLERKWPGAWGWHNDTLGNWPDTHFAEMDDLDFGAWYIERHGNKSDFFDRSGRLFAEVA